MTTSREELAEFRRELKSLKDCCLEEQIPEGITNVAYWAPSVPDGEDGAAVFKAKKGWFVLVEAQDNTGHG